MDILKEIESSKANITQIAELSGVSADRIYQWRRGSSLPNGNDIIAIEECLRKISDLSKQDIRKLVAQNHIKSNEETANNSIKVAGAAAINNNDETKKPLTNQKEKEKDIVLPQTKEEYMELLREMMQLIREEQANTKMLLISHDTVTRTGEKNADSMAVVVRSIQSMSMGKEEGRQMGKSGAK